MIKGAKPNFYLNPVAMLYLMAQQLIKVLIAGRGFGKSFVNGISIMMKVASLPRSRGLFIGATYTQILTNTLLPMKSAWEWFGYHEGIDYVVGKKPPAFFATPYQRPDRYENVITWRNGTTIILASMDRPQLIRGGNNDWVITDEALLVKEDQYSQIVAPTVRGSHNLLQGKPGHLAEEFTSSMPYGSMGEWLLKKEMEARNEKSDTFYIEGTSWDNIEILTEKVLKKWKRTMPPVIYLIEVMNRRIRQLGSTFYPSLTDDHFYTNSYEYSFIENLGLKMDTYNPDSRWDKDCDTDEPIMISHDWGAFNCITVAQHSMKDYFINEHFTIPANTVRFIKYMHVSHPNIHQDLAQQFCDYYKHHRKKVILQYGDKSGNDRQANSRASMFTEFADILKKRGNDWRVIKQRTGDAEHLARHNFINTLHRQANPALPRVMYNANNCKDLRIALESAPMKDGKKDKRSEGNPKIKQEHATHGTDAHDYLLWFGFNPKMNAPSYSSEATFNK